MQLIDLVNFAYRTLVLALIVLFLPLSTKAAVQLPLPARTWTSPGHTRYYVDSIDGSDSNNGKSADKAWKTLSSVNDGVFAPGDWILLKAGSHWDTFLAPGGGGEAKHPVKVTSYGSGPPPSLDAHATVLATVSIHNGEYWDIENLNVTNTSTSLIPRLCGVEISLYDFGIGHGYVLRNLYVHDIASPEDKWNGGSGIFIDNRGDKVKSAFDGLLVQECHLVHTDRNGITMDSGYWDRQKWFPSRNVIMRDNLLEDIGGDCIVAIGCDGAILEYNAVHKGRQRATDWASGIWVWSCDNSVIQYNEIDGMHGQLDAQGFDSDWNTRNTLIQYNYSHDNEGGFAMCCNNGDVKSPINIGNDGAVIRYNISQNDGFRTFTFSGKTTNVQVYNNDVFVGKNISTVIFFSWNWGNEWGDHIAFSNNIFDIQGQGVFQLNGTTNDSFVDNDWFGNLVKIPSGTNQLAVDPLFESAGNATDDLASLSDYEVNSNSPCLRAGVLIPNNGGLNYWQKKLKQDHPNIGAE